MATLSDLLTVLEWHASTYITEIHRQKKKKFERGEPLGKFIYNTYCAWFLYVGNEFADNDVDNSRFLAFCVTVIRPSVEHLGLQFDKKVFTALVHEMMKKREKVVKQRHQREHILSMQ